MQKSVDSLYESGQDFIAGADPDRRINRLVDAALNCFQADRVVEACHTIDTCLSQFPTSRAIHEQLQQAEEKPEPLHDLLKPLTPYLNHWKKQQGK